MSTNGEIENYHGLVQEISTASKNPYSAWDEKEAFESGQRAAARDAVNIFKAAQTVNEQVVVEAQKKFDKRLDFLRSHRRRWSISMWTGGFVTAAVVEAAIWNPEPTKVGMSAVVPALWTAVSWWKEGVYDSRLKKIDPVER